MNIKYIVIHASATARQMDIGAAEINIWHKERGWDGIGYHLVIRRNGLVEFGRPLNKPGAHVKGYNYISWGVCMVGGLDNQGNIEDNYTKEQYETLVDVIRYLKRLAPTSEVVGHRDLSPDINGDGIVDKWEWVKECPCFDVSTFLKEVVWKKKKGWFGLK